MNEMEKIKRYRGQHLKKNEVKVEIIKFILENDSPVLEPDIREHLKNTFATKDNKTMKMHFQDLQKLQCIKKVANSGKENEWKIDSIKHLENIKNFKEIELNRNKKAVEIVVEKFVNIEKTFIESLHIDLPDEGHIRAYLRMSPTFFDMCMSTDIETLYKRWVSLNEISNDINIYVVPKPDYEDPDEFEYDPYDDYDFFDPNDNCDYYRNAEIPYLAFKNCVYMDILTGKDSTMLERAKKYIRIKELYTREWNPYSLQDDPEMNRTKPSNILYFNYEEFSDIADYHIQDLMEK